MLKEHFDDVTTRWADMTAPWRVKHRLNGIGASPDRAGDVDSMDLDTSSDKDSVLGDSDSPIKAPRITVEDRSIASTGSGLLAAAAALAGAVGRVATGSPRSVARSPARSPANRTPRR